jgi:hypothetical protein
MQNVADEIISCIQTFGIVESLGSLIILILLIEFTVVHLLHTYVIFQLGSPLQLHLPLLQQIVYIRGIHFLS